jgi:flagellar biosynthetic protein FliO
VDWAPNASQNGSLRIIFGILQRPRLAGNQRDAIQEKNRCFFDNSCVGQRCAIGDKPGIRELFFNLMLSVLFLVVLGVAAIYVSKRFLPKITKLSGKEIRIAETVHLGPRKAVHLLEVGERRFLIGITNESITRLADLTSPAAASAFAETSALTELSVQQEMDNN